MELKNFLDEFKNLSDERPKIAGQIKSHNLPVIIFGAAAFAKIVTEELNKFDIEVAGYAVDAAYYKPNQNYLGKPIYNFAELSSQPDKYVFVLGLLGNVNHGKRALNFMNSKNYIHYSFTVERLANIDYNYILANKKDFLVTYNLLADDFSRGAMLAYLKSHISTSSLYIEKFFSPAQYFNKLTSNANRGGVRGLWRV